MSQRTPTPRYHALDCVRAAAMLLGVLFHAIQFGGMGGGFGPGGSRGFSDRLLDWLHSFRMPLFLLISGFFCALMLEKYGARRYLLRRWSRIGLPLLLGLFTIVPLYQVIRGGGGGPGGPPPFAGGDSPGGPPFDMANLPPPPPGFVPPPLVRFDANGDGTLDDTEWANARAEIQAAGPPGGGFSGAPEGAGPMPFGPPGGPGGAFPGAPEGAGPMPFGPPGGFGSGPPGPMPFGPPGGGLAAKLFGPFAQYLRLDYLWFLWYLLVFATVAPAVTKLIAYVLDRPARRLVDACSRNALRFGLVPLVLAALATPALLHSGGFLGWSLGPAAGIFRSFPDFLWSFEPDMPFYFLYFLAGWWLFHWRAALSDVARLWLPSLLVGLLAHAAATWLSDTYAMRRDLPNYQLLRGAGYWLYCVGSAYTAFGFLGFFQRYVSHATRTGRYLADTAFWVYFVHQPILAPILDGARRLGWPWWAQGLLAAGLTTLAALFLYEAVVRPTPLVRLFGPSAGGKRIAQPAARVPTGNGSTASSISERPVSLA